MQLTINIPDNQAIRVVNAFAITYGYQNQIPDPTNPEQLTYIPNPQTKAQFAKQKVVDYIKSVVLSHEWEEARKSVTVSEVDVA